MYEKEIFSEEEIDSKQKMSFILIVIDFLCLNNIFTNLGEQSKRITKNDNSTISTEVRNKHNRNEQKSYKTRSKDALIVL